MATGTICSQFNITLIGDLNAGAAANTFTTTRALTVVGITAINNVAANGTLTLSTAAGLDLTATSAAGNNAGAAAYLDCTTATNSAAQSLAVSTQNASVASGVTLTALDSAANLISVVIHCIGNPSQSLGTLI